MTFDEFIEIKVKQANDYASGITDDEECIAADAWRAGALEAAEHMLAMWNKPWSVYETQKDFVTKLRNDL